MLYVYIPAISQTFHIYIAGVERRKLRDVEYTYAHTHTHTHAETLEHSHLCLHHVHVRHSCTCVTHACLFPSDLHIATLAQYRLYTDWPRAQSLSNDQGSYCFCDYCLGCCCPCFSVAQNRRVLGIRTGDYNQPCMASMGC